MPVAFPQRHSNHTKTQTDSSRIYGPTLNVIECGLSMLSTPIEQSLLRRRPMSASRFRTVTTDTPEQRGLRQWLVPGGFVLLLALASAACAFLPGESPSDLVSPTPPSEDILTFVVPLYRTTLAEGESVAGTQMTYLGRSGDTYNVTIDGLQATKRIGDSFSWKGVIAPGVVARYSLRLSPTFITNDLLVAGPVELIVLNPIPVELDNSILNSDALLYFSEIGVDQTVPKGGRVLGTSLVFEGDSDQGAQLSGTRGFPYREVGDSLIWTGRLRGSATVRYSLRVASVSAESMRLLGTAELWVDPGR